MLPQVLQFVDVTIKILSDADTSLVNVSYQDTVSMNVRAPDVRPVRQFHKL